MTMTSFAKYAWVSVRDQACVDVHKLLTMLFAIILLVGLLYLTRVFWPGRPCPTSWRTTDFCDRVLADSILRLPSASIWVKRLCNLAIITSRVGMPAACGPPRQSRLMRSRGCAVMSSTGTFT